VSYNESGLRLVNLLHISWAMCETSLDYGLKRHLTSARTHRAFSASALQTWREVVVALRREPDDLLRGRFGNVTVPSRALPHYPSFSRNRRPPAFRWWPFTKFALSEVSDRAAMVSDSGAHNSGAHNSGAAHNSRARNSHPHNSRAHNSHIHS